MKLDNKQMEVVALLPDCLCYVPSNRSYTQNGTEGALDNLVNAIADFITQRETKLSNGMEK